MKDNSTFDKLIFLGIVFVAVALRFWKFWDIPFTYDELSALSRLQFGTFSDLIRFGVTPDGHPAGVQVFLWYWTRLFGEQEFVVKLPFLLSGAAAVYLSYRIGRLWFNKTTGILTAVYISSLQMMVMYSQIARPYVSGLFLTLLMVLFWSRYFFKGNRTKDLLLFVFFASLSTYNHHFSLLFAAVVGFSGLLFVTKKNFWQYVFAGLAILVLYLPHLSIFFSQLNEGGIGSWLSKPGPSFLFEFLDWLFHFSPLVWLVFLAAGLFAVFAKGEPSQVTAAARKRIVLFVWFFLPLLIGFAYSVMVAPVLQFSMLIFSTPFLFIVFFSGAKNISPKTLVLPLAFILLVNIGSLVWGRQYYQVFYKQPFEEVVKQAVQLESGEFKNNVFLIDDYIPFYTEYYFNKFGKTVPYYTTRNKELDFSGFRKVVNSIEQGVVVTSGLKADYFQVVKERFPFLIAYEKGFTFEQYAFSKLLPQGEKELLPKVVAETSFADSSGNWKINKEYVEYDTVFGSNVFHLYPKVRFGPEIKLPLEEITDSRFLFIDMAVEIQSLSRESRAALVAVIKKGDETLRWKAVNFSSFGLKKGKWANVFMTTDLLSAIGQKGEIEGCTFQTYIWNPDSSEFLIRSYSITSRPGNPLRYSLFYDIAD
ncbi:MAG: glycosyltransferase family 39 protein [Bacteroidales bacterium]|nr:glycosyltransferase family 39 protein [Bacteroidales bacterium]